METAQQTRISAFRGDHFGMFIHWGSYSVRGIEASWPLFHGDVQWHAYEDLADRFDPVDYDPDAWMQLARSAGARYAILTTKHHDGFALWDTKLSDYSAVHHAAGRDLVRPYVEACRRAGLKVSFYFSLCDWHHPDYPTALSGSRMARADSGQTPDAPASIAEDPERWDRYIAFMHGQVRELLTGYGPIDLLWFDGQWEHTPEEWRAAELEAMIHELQPHCVVNDRIGDPALADYVTSEQHVPVTASGDAWETCLTINETWAWNPRDRAFKSCAELIGTLAEVTAKGGNFLLNVGPTEMGTIAPEFASRWAVIARWMESNAEAIFGTGAGLEPGAFYGPSTGGPDAIYLFLFGPVNGDEIRVRGLGRRVVDVSVLATEQPLEMEQASAGLAQGLLRVRVPAGVIAPLATVVRLRLAPER